MPSHLRDGDKYNNNKCLFSLTKIHIIRKQNCMTRTTAVTQEADAPNSSGFVRVLYLAVVMFTIIVGTLCLM